MNAQPIQPTPTVEKLAYSTAELCSALGLCQTTLWRLNQRGLLRAIPGLRHKLYSKAEVQRFLAGKGAHEN
jgi:hypothetical protein